MSTTRTVEGQFQVQGNTLVLPTSALGDGFDQKKGMPKFETRKVDSDGLEIVISVQGTRQSTYHLVGWIGFPLGDDEVKTLQAKHGDKFDVEVVEPANHFTDPWLVNARKA